MAADRANLDQRVLLMPATARDGEACRNLLGSTKIDCIICDNVGALSREIDRGAATVIVPEEVILSDEFDQFRYVLARQPVWSDLPLIVLSRAGAESPAVLKMVSVLRNVSLIERPLRVTTLLSVVNTALRARQRQYQLRDYLIERERTEAELRDARARLEAALSAAELAGRMKDDFLTTLSHELRTPLNAILGWAQILRGSVQSSEDLAEGLETIERNARAQTQIIEDLLDMSRIISGKVRLDVRPIDLASVVQSAIDTVTPAADAKRIRIRMITDSSPNSSAKSSAGSSGAEVTGDPNRLQQVFWNLLSNAIKFTPNGGQIRIVIDRNDSDIEISVIDTGEGIKPEFLPQVFDRFRQADASTTRRHGGLGLGLSIVKQLVELHGGTVRAESAGPGRGAAFRVRLPITIADSEAAPAPTQALSTSTSHRNGSARFKTLISGLKVLVVDDDADARSLLQRLFEDCHAVVTLASSAEEAFQDLKRCKPDVLVSDIGMPGEDGYSLIRRVRALGASGGGDVPAVALTAYARSEDRAKSVASGFQKHIPKPVEPDDLIRSIATLTGRA